MAGESWHEAQLLQSRRQSVAWRNGTAAGTIRFGRVERPGRVTATASASYWDVVILTDACEDYDLNHGNMTPSTALPVYPYAPSAAVPATTNVDVGDTVTLWVPTAAQGSAGSWEDVTTYGLSPAYPEASCFVIESSGNTCGAGLTDFGVLVD